VEKSRLLALLLMLSLILISFILYHKLYMPTKTQVSKELQIDTENIHIPKDIIVIHIGDTNELLNMTLDALRDMGIKVSSIRELPNDVEALKELFSDLITEGRHVVIMVDGDWIARQLMNETIVTFNGTETRLTVAPPLRNFFTKVIYPRNIELNATFIAIGGKTRALIEALYAVGLYPGPKKICEYDPLMICYSLVPSFGATIADSNRPIPIDFILETLSEWFKLEFEEKEITSAEGDSYLVGALSKLIIEKELYPYGKLNVLLKVYKQAHDHVSSYDWYYYKVKIQTIPGYTKWGTDWCTDEIYAYHWVSPGDGDRMLVDYSPDIEIEMGETTVILESRYSPEGPSTGFSVSWTYEIPDVNVHDISDYGENMAAWYHDLVPGSDASKYTYVAEPGFVVKTVQNVDDGGIIIEYKVVWRKLGLVGDTYTMKTGKVFAPMTRARGDGSHLCIVKVHAWPVTDNPYYQRYHGLSIDRPLPESWWTGEYYKIHVFYRIDSEIGYIFDKVLIDQYVEYANTGYVSLNCTWYAKIYIDGALKAEGEVGRDQPLRAYR